MKYPLFVASPGSCVPLMTVMSLGSAVAAAARQRARGPGLLVPLILRVFV